MDGYFNFLKFSKAFQAPTVDNHLDECRQQIKERSRKSCEFGK